MLGEANVAFNAAGLSMSSPRGFLGGNERIAHLNIDSWHATDLRKDNEKCIMHAFERRRKYFSTEALIS